MLGADGFLPDRAIWCQGLTRRFGELTAVDDLTFQVATGEVFGFLGHNGAGKTTTIRLLNGVITPNSGSACVLGLDPVTEGSTLRRRTGVLTATPSVDERLTARDNLRTYAELYDVPRAVIPRRVEELLSTFELSERGDEKVGAYSKGMQHRLALARALLHEPEILFLDEPTAGLDPVATRQVHELIIHLSHQARTVFICTHNLAEAQRLCSRVAVLERGRKVALGTPMELASELGVHQRLEIELAPPGLPAALAILNRVPGLTVEGPYPCTPSAYSGATEGDGAVQLTVAGAARDMVPDLVDTLVGASVRIHRVTPQEVSLEDVYFALQDRIASHPEQAWN